MLEITKTWSARDFFELGTSRNISLKTDSSALTLYSSRLIENDAAGAGYPAPLEKIGPAKKIKKILPLDRTPVKRVRLLVYHTTENLWHTESYPAPVLINFNDH